MNVSSKKKQYDLSVIVLAFNSGEYISECINSILNQDYKGSVHVIVCDDYSTDHSQQILKRYDGTMKENFKVTCVSNGENLGSWMNFINGLEKTNSRYVSYLEADDVWTDTKKLSIQIDTLESRTSISATCCGCHFIDRDGKRSSQKYYRRDTSRLYTNRELWDYPPFQTSGLVFRKSDLPELPQNIPRYNCNDKILYALLSSKKPIWYDATKMVGYRYHDGNLTSNYTRFQNQVSRPLSANWTLLKHLGLRYITPFTRAFLKFGYYYIMGFVRPRDIE